MKKGGGTKSKGFGGNALRSLQNARFPYAGSIRPGVQTPQRTVGSEIVQPDYAVSGTPNTGVRMLPWIIEVKSEAEIEKMRASGRLAREILDMAGQAVEVGVSTEEIDKMVHNEIVKVWSRTVLCCMTDGESGGGLILVDSAVRIPVPSITMVFPNPVARR